MRQNPQLLEQEELARDDKSEEVDEDRLARKRSKDAPLLTYSMTIARAT